MVWVIIHDWSGIICRTMNYLAEKMCCDWSIISNINLLNVPCCTGKKIIISVNNILYILVLVQKSLLAISLNYSSCSTKVRSDKLWFLLLQNWNRRTVLEFPRPMGCLWNGGFRETKEIFSIRVSVMLFQTKQLDCPIDIWKFRFTVYHFWN